MLMIALALLQDLAEIEVAPGEKPRADCLFKRDEDDGRYRLYEAWEGGRSPRLPKPTIAFSAMNRERACAWALDVVRGSFEGEWSDLSRPTNGPDTVTRADRKPVPAGWGLDFLQRHKGVAFYDPDEPGERAGVIASLQDGGDPTEGFVSASITVKRWTVLKEHGPAKNVVKEGAATATALKDFAKTYPELRGEKAEIEAVLFWAMKPGAPERRIPLWHVTATGPWVNARKPQIHRYRVDAWTGAIVSSREVAIPGGAPVPEAPPPPLPKPK